MVTNRDRSCLDLVVHYSVLWPFVIEIIQDGDMIVDSTEAGYVLLPVTGSASSQETRLSSLLLQSCLVSPQLILNFV